MTAPMPETMSPREKVIAILDEETTVGGTSASRSGSVNSSELADLILAALASSGDHAELARLAEAAKAEWPDGAWFRDYELHYGPRGQIDRWDAAFIAAANPATVLALIAENAALKREVEMLYREDLKVMALSSMDDDLQAMTDRAVKAERQRDEAVELLRQIVETPSAEYDDAILSRIAAQSETPAAS